MTIGMAFSKRLSGLIRGVAFSKRLSGLIREVGDFQKNENFSFSENNLNIKWYERKVNILKQAQW